MFNVSFLENCRIAARLQLKTVCPFRRVLAVDNGSEIPGSFGKRESARVIWQRQLTRRTATNE